MVDSVLGEPGGIVRLFVEPNDKCDTHLLENRNIVLWREGAVLIFSMHVSGCAQTKAVRSQDKPGAPSAAGASKLNCFRGQPELN